MEFSVVIFFFTVDNSCDGNNCSHLCLLSSTREDGYSCACPDGSVLLNDSLSCKCVKLHEVGEVGRG